MPDTFIVMGLVIIIIFALAAINRKVDKHD